nr:hypothetical protein [uncultured Treponema sp.]
MDRHTRKRNKALTCSFFAILAFIFSLVSCDNFNKPVREYFEFYTTEAVVGKTVLPDTSGTYNGITCVESNDNKEIIFHLMNPKGFNIDAGYNFYDLMVGDVPTSSAKYSFVQSLDKNTLTLTFSKEFLETVDKGCDSLAEYDPDTGNPTGRYKKNISGTISLSTSDGGAARNFKTPFHFSIMVNSAPPPVKSPILQLDAESGGKYILCFFVPITSGSVHEDTKKIFINNDEFKLDSDGTVKNADGTANSNFSYTKPSSIFVIPGCDVDFDSLPEITGYKKCFYKTGIPQSDSETKFTITLKDDYNFTSSANVSNKAKRLAPPMILNGAAEVASGSNHLADGDTKQLGVIFKHWGKNIDHTPSGPVTIYYEIEKTSAPQNTITGHKDVAAFGSTVVNLSGGTYTIRSWVTKPYSIDSEVLEVTNVVIKEPQLYYVANAAGGGSDEDSHDGSKNKPFASFKRAFEKFAETSESSCEIRLKTDLAPSDEDCETSTNAVIGPSFSGSKTVSIRGWNGTKTIDMSNLSGIHAVYAVNNLSLTLENLVFTGGSDTSTETSAIYNAGTLTLKNCTVTANTCTGVYNDYVNSSTRLNFEEKVVIDGNFKGGEPFNLYLTGHSSEKITSITNLSSASRIGVLTSSEPETGNPVTFTEAWDASFGNPWNVFSSDSSNYYVDYKSYPNTSIVVLKKQGASISFGEDNLSFHTQTNANGMSFILYKNSNPADGTISVVSKTLKYGADTVLQSTTDSVVSVSGNTVGVNVSSLESGSYILYLRLIYKGSTYDVNLPFSK